MNKVTCSDARPRGSCRRAPGEAGRAAQGPLLHAGARPAARGSPALAFRGVATWSEGAVALARVPPARPPTAPLGQPSHLRAFFLLPPPPPQGPSSFAPPSVLRLCPHVPQPQDPHCRPGGPSSFRARLRHPLSPTSLSEALWQPLAEGTWGLQTAAFPGRGETPAPTDNSFSKEPSKAASTPPSAAPLRTPAPRLGSGQRLAPRGGGGEPRAPVLAGRPTRRQLVLETQFPPDSREGGGNNAVAVCAHAPAALPPPQFDLSDVRLQVAPSREQRALCVI